MVRYMSSHEVQVVGLFNRKTGYRVLAYVFAMQAAATWLLTRPTC